MRKTTGFAATLAAAGLVAAGFMGPASAAPSNKGTTYVVPSTLTGSVLNEDRPIARPGYFVDEKGVAFGIVGNPNDDTIEHVGGLNVEGTSGPLELRNFQIRVADGRVSGIVNDSFRADLFRFELVSVAEDGDLTVNLFFTDTAAGAIGGDVDENDFAGTATIDR